MSNNTRKERLVSPEYREILGKNLMVKRIEFNYSRKDISIMTTIPENTVNSIEKGITINIDYYVEYAKAVQYPLATLTDFNIPLKPVNKLPKDRLETVNLTAKIRQYIVKSNFLDNGKVVSEIMDELIRLKLVSNDIKSQSVAGVMRNLKEDGFVSTGEKQGRKEVYLKMKN